MKSYLGILSVMLMITTQSSWAAGWKCIKDERPVDGVLAVYQLQAAEDGTYALTETVSSFFLPEEKQTVLVSGLTCGFGKSNPLLTYCYETEAGQALKVVTVEETSLDPIGPGRFRNYQQSLVRLIVEIKDQSTGEYKTETYDFSERDSRCTAL